MAEKKFSELTAASILGNDDIFALSQIDSGSLTSKKTTLTAIANHINTVVQYTNAYGTQAKTTAGAINELKQLISLIPQFSIEVVEELPTEDISDTTIYLVPAEDPEVGNYYEEYIHVNDSWELVGTTAVDLSDYYTKAQADGKFAVTITNTISPTTTTKKVADIKQNNVTTPIYSDDADKILRAAFGEHTASGNPVTVDAFLGLEVASECNVTMLPIQDLSHGNPSPANICPISGRNTVTLTRTGKNLLDLTRATSGTAINNQGQEAPVSNITVSDYIEISPNTDYYITSGVGSSSQVTSAVYDENKQFLRVLNLSGTGTQSGKINTGNDAKYLRMNFYTSRSSEVMFSLGDAATAYEPYVTPETHTHTYASTVYGGTDDFVSGEGKKTHSYLSYDSFTRTNDHQFYKNVGSQVASRYGRANIICDRMPTADSTIPTGTAVNAVHTNSSGAIVVHTEQAYSTASAFMTAMGGQINFAVRTSAGADITNTPEDISLIKGVNIVSTDADSLELKYSADIKTYIDSKLA